MNDQISVVIPCFNDGQYLAETISKLKQQSIQPFEIIIVNDGSTDQNTLDVLEALAKDELIKVLHKQNGRMSAARNYGVLKAKGNFIAAIDADDYFDNWKIGMQALANEPNIFCKISGVGMMDPKFTEASIRPWIEHCISIFGPQRCMLGSNWPLDRLFSSYDIVLNIYREIISQYSEEEQIAISSATANSFYRI